MTTCENCGKQTTNNKFCSRGCSTSVINKAKMKKKPSCAFCRKELSSVKKKYCTNTCQGQHRSSIVLEQWKSGKISGLDNTIGVVIPTVKEYLRQKYGNKCCLCGWSEVNPSTGKVPLVADHKDGNWQNNKEENLRLICPNCDSLQPTYGGSNRGKGRTTTRGLRKR